MKWLYDFDWFNKITKMYAKMKKTNNLFEDLFCF